MGASGRSKSRRVTRTQCARAPPHAGRLSGLLCACVRPEHADRRYTASARPTPGPGASQRVRDACGLGHARDAHETFAAYRLVALDGGPYDPLFLPRARLAPHLPLCLRRRTCSPRTSRRGLGCMPVKPHAYSLFFCTS
jgi:hypothetical protein